WRRRRQHRRPGIARRRRALRRLAHRRVPEKGLVAGARPRTAARGCFAGRARYAVLGLRAARSALRAARPRPRLRRWHRPQKRGRALLDARETASRSRPLGSFRHPRWAVCEVASLVETEQRSGLGFLAGVMPSRLGAVAADLHVAPAARAALGGVEEDPAAAALRFALAHAGDGVERRGQIV